jgi:periplasmic protein TonB
MEQELQKRQRWAVPPALVLSLAIHLFLMWIISAPPAFLYTPPPPPEPEPVPVAFVPMPQARPSVRPEPFRYEFPNAPETTEPVDSGIRSDRNRKAQTEDRSRWTAPSGDGAAAPAALPAEAQPRRPAAVDPGPPPRRPANPTPPPQPRRPASPDPPPPGEPGPPEADLPRIAALDPSAGPAAQRQPQREPYPTPMGQTEFDRKFDARGNASRSLFDPTVLERAVPRGQGSGTAGGSGEDSGIEPGLLSFDTQADELGPYARILYQKIKAAWVLPQVAKDFARGVTEVRFTIARDGTLGDLSVSSSSGWVPLDNAALNAIRGAAPLPPLPASFPAQRVGVRFRFYCNVPIPSG